MKNVIKHFIVSLTVALCVCGQVLAQTASLIPPGVARFFDNNGNPLSAGTVDFYVAGTTTRKTTWKNSGETITNTNPVVLDAGGKAIIYGEGTYRQIVKDRNGNLIWDAVTAPGGGGSTPTSIGDGQSVGSIKPWAGINAPAQYAFAYGQELSRATYPELLSAITQRLNVVCTASSNILTGISDTTQIRIGSPLEVSCVTSGTIVNSKTSSSVTVSNFANVSVNDVATFFPFGNGNSTTTYNVPDLRGYVIAGRSNMGGTASSNLTSTYFGTGPDAQGAAGGTQSKVLITGNLPAYTPTGTVGITDPGHTHDVKYSRLNQYTAGAVGAVADVSTAGANTASAAALSHTTGITASYSGVAQGGTSTAFSIVQPTITLNYVIKVSPDVSASGFIGVSSIGGMQGVILCGSGITCAGNTISSTGGGGGGSVSITAGTGLSVSPNPITGTGSVSLLASAVGTIGGVQAINAVSNNWINSINTSGVPQLSQPAFSNISGQTTLAQLPSISAATILGNNTGGASVPIALTAAQTKTLLGLATVATTGSASDITTGTLPAAQLPNPTTSALGGVRAINAIASNWINSINTSGIPQLSQPAFTDITGSVSAAQLPTIADQRVLCNISGGTAAPTACTAAQVTTLMVVMVGDSGSGGVKGLVPAPAAGDAAASRYLKADGTWSTPAGSGSTGCTVAGSNGQFQYNQSGSCGGSSGLTYATSGILTTAIALSATDIPLIAKGTTAQSADIFEVRDTSNTVLFAITSAGNLAVATNKFNVTASNGNTAIAGTLGVTSDVAVNTNKFNITASSGATTSASTITATALIPSSSTLPANGLYLPSANTPGIAANSISVAQFNTVGSGVNYLSLTPAATGNAPSLSVGGSDTNINLNLTGKGTGSAVAIAQLATSKALIAKGTTSQSANLQEWQDTGGTILASVSPAGNILTTGTLGSTGNFSVNTNKFTIVGSSGNTSIAGTVNITPFTTAGVVLNNSSGLLSSSTTVFNRANAICNNSAGDRAIIQAAINTGAPTVHIQGPCLVTTGDTSITNFARFQTIEGDGQGGYAGNVPTIKVNAVITGGLFVFTAGGAQLAPPAFKDIWIDFDNELNALAPTPAIYGAQNNCNNGMKLTRVQISRANVAVNLQCNAGQSVINDFQCSAYDRCMILEDITDSVHINALHCFPFNMSNIGPEAASATCLDVGDVDDLKITKSLSIYNLAINFRASVYSGLCGFGEINSFDFDNNNGIVMSCGTYTVSNSFFTLGSNAKQHIVQSGGYLTVTGSIFLQANGGTTPAISMTGGGTVAQFTGNNFNTGSGDVTAISLTAGNNLSDVVISGNRFNKTANIAYTRPLINVTTGRVRMTGNSVGPGAGGGSGNMVSLGTTNNFQLIGMNSAPGYTWPTCAGNDICTSNN